MLEGTKMYGSWKDGSAIFKNSKGYYIEVPNFKSTTPPLCKKYLKRWKPAKNTTIECFTDKKWKTCKNKKVNNKTKKSSRR